MFVSKAINADRDLQDIIIDSLGIVELRMSELEEELHKEMISDETNNQNLNISKLKKRIKYCRNPLEKQSLQRELNALYKKRKRELNYENTLWKDEKYFCKIGQPVRS